MVTLEQILLIKKNFLDKSFKMQDNRNTIKRRTRKVIASIVDISIFCLIYYYLNLDDNWQDMVDNRTWCLYMCFAFLIFQVIFFFMLWILEFRKNPYDYTFDSLDYISTKMTNISSNIRKLGVVGHSRKTYSWPFALPFDIINLLVVIIHIILMKIGKLVVKII